MPRRSFDKAYYDRFYRDHRTRVSSKTEMRKLARFVGAYLHHLDQPVDTILDLGCGVGAWRDAARQVFRRARYTGVEVSRYMCKEYGWVRGSVVDYTSSTTYDLVICHGVLQYLNARDARRAVANLSRLCGGVLFLEALTAEDWEHNCDRSVTDGDVFLRPAEWYRGELRKYFTNCGGGVFLSPSSPVIPYELEKME